jgi:RNA polymerase sigma-70 factor (ECF subfamily)
LLLELRELVGRCLVGDQAAMTELVERYKQRVYALCYRMLGHRQDAEDVAQQTFLRVLKSLGRWDPQREFEPWLLAIAGNRCRTALAARARRAAVRSLNEPAPDPAPDPSDADQLSAELNLALQTLRPSHREAFVLFHVHEMSYEEIARQLGRPVGTVKTWIHRARLALIRQLSQREVLEGCRYAVR